MVKAMVETVQTERDKKRRLDFMHSLFLGIQFRSPGTALGADQTKMVAHFGKALVLSIIRVTLFPSGEYGISGSFAKCAMALA